MFTIEDIPVELRTVNHGVYNRGIYTCPECDNDMVETTYEFAVGFTSVPGKEVGMVIVCDKCGTRFWFHANETTYSGFLSTRERLAREKLTKEEK
jgi:transcription elongation factor Elf1